MKLLDTHGRHINYLRLSVTDRCNLRCSYCMPEQGVEKLCHDDILTYEDLICVAEESIAIGIEKIRITGGEPLVRRDIIPFLKAISAVPGLKQLVLTTNGLLLEELAADLYQAGVQRLNISLDSLKPETFARITRGGDVNRVLRGLEAAERAGFPPHKINMVVMRGINDDEVLDFAAMTMDRPYAVRFIEYMPTLQAENWRDLSFSGKEILERIGERYQLMPYGSQELAGPSRNFKIRGSAGSIGIITPISGHFCRDCNRIRVTSAGMARGCLLSGDGIDLKPLLRSGDRTRLREALRLIVAGKPGGHGLDDENNDLQPFAMSQVGG
jgi:cyclic pyranopterin phosphate synthase